MNSLKDEICPELEDATNQLPAGLDAMYARMLSTISEKKKRQLVISILRWVVTAFRPLTLTEIGAALNLKGARQQDLADAAEDYVNLSQGILRIVLIKSSSANAPRTVIPVHASVIDFL